MVWADERGCAKAGAAQIFGFGTDKQADVRAKKLNSTRIAAV